ncbi:MAG: alpha/beta hydrolase [Bdellovibrionia bacterium]
MPFIRVGTENSGPIRLYYEDHGSGNPTVLIHGFPLSGKSWEKQVLALLESGRRVITYDRRGFGGSTKPALGYDYDTFASDLDKLMTKLDLRDAALVGFSMGGGEVARYLSTYGSERVNKAVFISSLPPYLLKTADNPDGVEEGVFDAMISSINEDRPAFLSKFLADFFNMDLLGGKRVSEEAFHFSWNIAANASPKGTMDCVSSWLTDFREDFQSIQVPVLIIHGDSDRILPISATGNPLHKSLKDSRMVVVEDGPHGLIWTHADKVNPELINFLVTDQSMQQDRGMRRAA